jgi:hypothetical protein
MSSPSLRRDRGRPHPWSRHGPRMHAGGMTLFLAGSSRIQTPRLLLARDGRAGRLAGHRERPRSTIAELAVLAPRHVVIVHGGPNVLLLRRVFGPARAPRQRDAARRAGPTSGRRNTVPNDPVAGGVADLAPAPSNDYARPARARGALERSAAQLAAHGTRSVAGSPAGGMTSSVRFLTGVGLPRRPRVRNRPPAEFQEPVAEAQHATLKPRASDEVREIARGPAGL